MDELAEKIGMDPLELRYKNVYREGSTTLNGCAPDAYSLPVLMDLVRHKYEAAKTKAAADSTPKIKKGVGISIGVYGCGLDGPDTAEADVELNTQTGYLSKAGQFAPLRYSKSYSFQVPYFKKCPGLGG